MPARRQCVINAGGGAQALSTAKRRGDRDILGPPTQQVVATEKTAEKSVGQTNKPPCAATDKASARDNRKHATSRAWPSVLAVSCVGAGDPDCWPSTLRRSMQMGIAEKLRQRLELTLELAARASRAP